MVKGARCNVKHFFLEPYALSPEPGFIAPLARSPLNNFQNPKVVFLLYTPLRVTCISLPIDK